MIYLGSDHGGFYLKEKIKNWLTCWGYRWQDLGNTIYEEDDDYPLFAFKVAQKVVEGEGKAEKPKGVLCCRSAAGMVIAANKVKGARCVAAFDMVMALHSRLHNDANILALSADFLSERKAKKILKVWLETEFSGEARHKRRLKEIRDFENK